MRFWDASALVPLFIRERGSDVVRRYLDDDPTVLVWTLSRVEFLSALARRRRASPESRRALQQARRRFLEAWPRWNEVVAVPEVRRCAERLVDVHPLRAADALQLGAALVAAEDDPTGLQIVTLDATLAEAAERESFTVLGLDDSR